ncbi:hypothetical protein, partial [Alistipes indistinctus]|uniref:hypothetical protein n=1 Tax=Alistipes indistinctus TaxID=626932 RepID=UPI003AB67006
ATNIKIFFISCNFLGGYIQKYVFYQHGTPKISTYKTENNTFSPSTPHCLSGTRKKKIEGLFHPSIP